MSPRPFRDALTDRLRSVGIACSEDALDGLSGYFDVLQKWNRRINLTGFDLDRLDDVALDRLFVEPVMASAHIPTGVSTMVDIGSGGGSPAIPMAVCIRRLQITMVESRSRKAVFLKEAVRELGLAASVMSRRVEELGADPGFAQRFDGASMRAVRPTLSLLDAVARLLVVDGRVFLFANKSQRLDHATMPPSLAYCSTSPLIAARGSELVVLRKIAS